jgi:radical SAM superfamily enzyme YgiQ (UPF0313 family)
MYKKIVIVSLPKQDLVRPPGALSILARACEDVGCDYEIRDFNLWLYKNTDRHVWHQINDNWDSVDPLDARGKDFYKIFNAQLEKFVSTIMLDQPDLIAISVFADNGSSCAVELINQLNQQPNRGSFDIAIGGTGIRARLPKYDYQELCGALLSDKSIDYYLFGEGEITFRKLLQKQTVYAGINNFDIDQIEDLDQFGLPSYSKINPMEYDYLVYPEVIVTGSRGCVRKCTYCDVAKYWPKFRYRSGRRIADELYYHYKNTGVSHFEFSDSLINGSLKQFREMNLAIIEYQKQDPNFRISYKGQYICRDFKQLKEHDYANMKAAGCDYIYVGVESFSDSVRHDMDKKFNNVDLDQHLIMCGKYGIANSFLMLVGYPTETQEDHETNLATLRKYQHYAQAGVIEMIVFGYTAGILEDTPLFHQQEQLSVVPEYDASLGLGSANWVSLDNPTLTLRERIRRWIELTELAIELGYRMPRSTHYIQRFINMMERVSVKPAIRIETL